MKIYDLIESGKFRHTARILKEIALATQADWTRRVLAAEPSWWGRQAISKASGGGGGFLIKKIPGGFRIYYANKGKYNYFAVIQRGRGSYDMKPALLASPRARSGKNGRYIIIPFTKNKDKSKIGPSNEINSVMTKIGSIKEKNADGKAVSRNTYSYRKDPGMTGKGNTYASEQVNKDKSVTRSYHKFVIVSEKSTGFIHKPIKKQDSHGIIQKSVNKALSHEAVKKAIAKDARNIVLDLIRKSK